MDANNYVAAVPGGFRVVVNGQDRGTYATQAEAEGKFNEFSGAGGPGVGYGHLEWEADYAQKWAMFQAQQNYLYERMRMLEIEEMRRTDERERHRIAVEATIARAQLTGWLQPGDFATLNGSVGAMNQTADKLSGSPDGTHEAYLQQTGLNMQQAEQAPQFNQMMNPAPTAAPTGMPTQQTSAIGGMGTMQPQQQSMMPKQPTVTQQSKLLSPDLLAQSPIKNPLKGFLGGM